MHSPISPRPLPHLQKLFPIFPTPHLQEAKAGGVLGNGDGHGTMEPGNRIALFYQYRPAVCIGGLSSLEYGCPRHNSFSSKIKRLPEGAQKAISSN